MSTPKLLSKQHSHFMDKYSQWQQQCKNDIIKSAKQNILARLKKINTIINKHGQINGFSLSLNGTNRIFNDIKNAILSWRGVEHESCKKIKKSFKEYRKTGFNWFNRNKSKIFGTFLFFPLIFGHIFQFCVDLNDIFNNNQKMIIFIELFTNILNETIQFKKTKCQPLIPYQTLMIQNRFKSYCRKFAQHYNIKWDLGNVLPTKISNVYQKDKCRSKKTSDSFIKILNSIH
eukprot:495589_1